MRKERRGLSGTKDSRSDEEMMEGDGFDFGYRRRTEVEMVGEWYIKVGFFILGGLHPPHSSYSST